MFKFTTGKGRSRFAAFGMVTLLFVAGLAFAVFENTAGARLMPSIGMAEQDETPADTIDPRLDPDDCLFDPAALKELTALPHGGTSADDQAPGVPANHPGTSIPSRVVAGGDDGTEPAGSPADAPQSPGGSSGSSDDPPPNGGTDGEGVTRPSAPHDRTRDTDCPGLQ